MAAFLDNSVEEVENDLKERHADTSSGTKLLENKTISPGSSHDRYRIELTLNKNGTAEN